MKGSLESNNPDRIKKIKETVNLIFKDKTENTIIWILLAIISALFFLIYGNLTQDDAYITFRYARNLSAGKGFVYNNNEWVLGTTTPLYTFLLAAISYISQIDIVRINKIVSILSLWLGAGFLYKIKKSLGNKPLFFPALIFITNPILRFFVGMESYFLLFLLLMTIWAYQTNRKRISSICGGFLILTRYEMFLVLLIIGIIDLLKERKIPFWLLLGLFPVMSWLVYAMIVFNNPIPLSVSAKLLAPRINFLIGGAVYWYQLLQENPFILITVILFFFGIFNILLYKNYYQEDRIILIFSLVYLLFATIFAGSFSWYYSPLVPGFVFITILGVDKISDFLKTLGFSTIGRKENHIKNWIQYIILILIVIIQSSYWLHDYNNFKDKIGDLRYNTYKQFSDWINLNTTEEQSIATFEIGYIGYFTDRKIIDLAGLVTPELFPWVDDGAEEALLHALDLLSPDFVLIPNNNVRQKEIMNSDLNYRMINQSFDGYLLFERD